MLNCCIKHKITREAMVGTDFVAMEADDSDEHDWKRLGVESCSSEEEFYECDGEKGDSESKSSQRKSKGAMEKRSSKTEKDNTNKSKISVQGQSLRGDDQVEDESAYATEEGAAGGESDEKIDQSEKSPEKGARVLSSRSFRVRGNVEYTVSTTYSLEKCQN